MPNQPLSAATLYHACELDGVRFETTRELEPIPGLIGQKRAEDAIRFSMGMPRRGYNLFVMGPPGSGKHSLVRQFLEAESARGMTPSDWCYVNNFSQPHQPRVLNLPTGQGRKLQRDMGQLIEDLRHAIPAAFESDEFQARAQEIEEQFKKKQEQALSEIHAEAERHQIRLLRTPGGFTFAPTRHGEVLSASEFEQLPPAEKEHLEELLANLHERLRKVFQQIPVWAKEMRDRAKEINQDTALTAVGQFVAQLKAAYAYSGAAVDYLDTVQRDVLDNVDEFRKQEEPSSAPPGVAEPRTPPFRRYGVNVIVEHDAPARMPVVHEDQPNYPNLVGRVEHLAQFGALITDFMLIKAGALHRSNGGYLILDAHKVLAQPYAWEGLKRALRSEEIRIDSLGQYLSLVSTVSLQPEPVPLQAKVILLGDRVIYYLLHDLDPEFRELFKVVADFEEHLDHSAENVLLYARFIATLAAKEKLRCLDRGAVARVIEHGMRLTGDSKKLSTHMRSLADLLHEADYWADQAGRSVVTSADIQQAIDAQIARNNRIQERLQAEILAGTLRIDTSGAKVAQLNGLMVMQVGDFAFAQPVRITATARLGDGDVIDIEREVELSGPVHSKGVLILSSLLGARYAKNRPFSLSASLVFEQSYGMVEGDSASLAELCALLSALAEIPLSQSLGVTGSVNQLGEVQAVGAINEKIEGFFDICQKRGLTGRQGVIMPADNVPHLMLRGDLREAAASGKFHVHAVRTLDEALELLTGMAAGVPDMEGNFPEGSVNGAIEARLEEMLSIKQSYAELFKRQPPL